MNLKLITSWDDGSEFDIIIAELLLKYGLPGIFYIPSNSALGKTEIKILDSWGLDVGGHTVSHPEDLQRLSDDALRREIVENKLWLQDILGRPVNSFCYPGGRFNERVIEAVRAAGYQEARTTLVGNCKPPQDPYRIETTAHIYPNRKEYGERSWYRFATEHYAKALRPRAGYYHIWGHGREIKQFGLWQQLEKLFKYISAMPT